MNVILFSTGCPRCKILEKKLDSKNILYKEIKDVDYMLSIGISEVPILKVDDTFYDFASAVSWINGL